MYRYIFGFGVDAKPRPFIECLYKQQVLGVYIYIHVHIYIHRYISVGTLCSTKLTGERQSWFGEQEFHWNYPPGRLYLYVSLC